MAFTDAEKERIRHYMGASRVFAGLYPLLESAITTVEQLTDSGATVAQVQVVLGKLATIETRRDFMSKRAFVDTAGDGPDYARIDPARGLIVLYMEGRLLCRELSIIFGFKAPLQDVFSPGRAHVPSTYGPDIFRES